MKTKYKSEAKKLIKSYIIGDYLNEEQLHVLNDCAAEYGQILGNVINTKFFLDALTENLYCLDCFS